MNAKPTLRRLICYVENAVGQEKYESVAYNVIAELGGQTHFYSGAGLAVRESNVDRQLRDSFYSADLVVVRLSGPDIRDNWAIPEIESGHIKPEKLLLYVDQGLDTSLLEQVQLPMAPNVVVDREAFAKQLAADVSRLLSE